MSRPFVRRPAERRRHAGSDPVPQRSGREFPPDMAMSILCGRAVTNFADESTWSWSTCPACDDRTRGIGGKPFRAETVAGTEGRP